MTRFAHKLLRFRRISAGVLVLATIALTGCGHPVKRKLNGRWMGQAVENVDDSQTAAATGWAKGTSFEFAGDTLTVAVPAEEPRSGKYKVLRAHENTVTVAVTRRDGHVDKAKFKLDDEHSMRWMIGDGRAVVLRREN